MSRRERSGRDSDSRRHRSGLDREPSPKRSRRETERVPSTVDLNVEDRRDRDQKHQRSRRDGKPETERIPSATHLNVEDQKHQRRLQDALPLEPVESGVVSKDFDKKPNGLDDGNKHVSDPTDIPRSRSYFQHDERGNAAQVGRSFDRRATTDRRQRDSKGDHHDSRQRDERSLSKRDNSDVWHHDGFTKMETKPAPPVRKRPAFREKKIPVDSENAEKAAPEPVKPNHSDRPMSFNERRGERDHNPHYSERHERPVGGDRKEAPRGGFLSRERYGSGGERYGSGGGGGNGKQWGREGFSSNKQGYHPGGNRAEKWKHDLFNEANMSPTKKNEEDQIAKVEALLSS
ncbi:cyclin-related [Euphorbia peplus]|nr:cyclin-related [Euphorbia peplus]